MKNYVQPGKMITVLLAAPVVSGQGVLIGSLFGVAAKNGAVGEEVEFMLEEVFELPKAAGAANIGAPAYWDDTNKLVTSSASGNKQIGAFHAAALSADPKAFVRLDGVSRA